MGLVKADNRSLKIALHDSPDAGVAQVVGQHRLIAQIPPQRARFLQRGVAFVEPSRIGEYIGDVVENGRHLLLPANGARDLEGMFTRGDGLLLLPDVEARLIHQVPVDLGLAAAVAQRFGQRQGALCQLPPFHRIEELIDKRTQLRLCQHGGQFEPGLRAVNCKPFHQRVVVIGIFEARLQLQRAAAPAEQVQ